ncbi:pfs domain-containing protein [Colletotrichum filicis]|nr:pfs domain-containing protein [Colletotrichum filicis]
MEAVGSTAAILQLVELSLKVTSEVYNAYTIIRDAKDIRNRIQREMTDLVRVLGQLMDTVSDKELADETNPGHVRVLRKLLIKEDSPLANCAKDIAEIRKLLQEARSVTMPFRKGDIDRRLANIAAIKREISFAIQTQSMTTVLDIRRILESQGSTLRQLAQAEADKAIFTWLNSPDVWKNLHNAILKWQPGTGEWLTKTPEYVHWRRNSGCLWLSGMPGAGKTVMSSTIVTTLLNEEQTTASAVVYSYFDFAEKSQQEAQSFLRACLDQLAAKSSEACDLLVGLRTRCSRNQGHHPLPDELLGATVAAMGCFPEVFFIVDALDECSERKLLLNLLRKLDAVPNLHLVLLSRREEDIKDALSAWTQELPLEGKKLDEDIAAYIQQRISTSQQMREWTDEDRTKVEARLKEKARGMFRYAQCHLDSLERCVDSGQVDEILESLPSDLPSTYERVLINLHVTSAMRIREVLLALAFARRPLTVEEVVDMVRISTSDYRRRVKKPNRVYLKQLLSLCSSLVSVSVDGSGPMNKQELRLAHASVKDYLVSDHLRCGPASAFYTTHGQGNLLLAAKGVACLLEQDDVSRFGPHTLEEVPFLQYSALNWTYHAREANLEVDRGNLPLEDLVFTLLHCDDDTYINWHRITGRHGPAAPVEGCAWDAHIRDGGKLTNGGEPATKEILLDGHHINRPLHHATHWDLWRVVQRLLDAGHDPNGLSSGNRTALHYGALQRSLKSMKLIIERGGNVDSGDWIGDTPSIFCVSKAKDPETMKFFMDHRASFFHVSRRSGSLLQCAAMEGDPAVLEVILKEKPKWMSADIGSDHNHDEIVDLATPLQCASYGGRLECIKLLLRYRADINSDEGQIGTPLHAAAAAGKLDAFKLLLHEGADVTATKGRYGSVLWAAGYGGNRDCVRICFEQKLSIEEADIEVPSHEKDWQDNSPDQQGRLISFIITAARDRYCRDIFDAARRGMTSRVQAFLDQSENRTVELEKKQEIHMRTPLSWAAGEGHIDTVKYLANEGADPNTWARGLETPLEFACQAGQLEMVKCLLSVGSKADFRHPGKYPTAAICAERSGNQQLVEFLKELEEDRNVTFEFEGQVYHFVDDGGYGLYKPKA